MTFATDWGQVLIEPLWGLVLAALVFGLVWLFRAPLGRVARELGVTRLSFMGVDIEWIVRQAQDAYQGREAPPPGPEGLRSFAILSTHLSSLVRGRRILWVDDHPQNNVNETRLIRALGVDVENALTTAETLERVLKDPARFDLIISNWTRDGQEEGPALAETLRDASSPIPVMFYAGTAGPARHAEAARVGALGVTAVPDELLERVLVALATTHRVARAKVQPLLTARACARRSRARPRGASRGP